MTDRPEALNSPGSVFVSASFVDIVAVMSRVEVGGVLHPDDLHVSIDTVWHPGVRVFSAFDADRLGLDDCDFMAIRLKAYGAPVSDIANCVGYSAKQIGRRLNALADAAGISRIHWPVLIPVLSVPG